MSKKHNSKFLCSRMMLPEHAAALNEHKRVKEEELTYYIPEYDEQQMEEWESLLQRSMSEEREIEITYMSSKGPVVVRGIVVEIKPLERCVLLQSEKKIKILYENIMGVVP